MCDSSFLPKWPSPGCRPNAAPLVVAFRPTVPAVGNWLSRRTSTRPISMKSGRLRCGVSRGTRCGCTSRRRSFWSRVRGIVVDQPALEPVGPQVADVEELVGVLGVGLVVLEEREGQPLVRVDVVAELGQQVLAFVARGDQQVVARPVVAALAGAVAEAVTPILAAAGGRSRP